MKAVRLPIVIPTIRTQWGGASGEADIDYIGLALGSSPTIDMQFRPFVGQEGAALISLTGVMPGNEGVAGIYDPAMLDPDTGLPVGGTKLRPQINQATLQTLPWGQVAPDEPLQLQYDMLVGITGQPRQLLLYGPVTIYRGVTI